MSETIPYGEMSARGIPWHTTFIGQPQQHNYWLYCIIDRVLLAHPEIRSIVEIGTGAGAVSSVFGLWGIKRGMRVLTIDRVMRHDERLLQRLGVEYLQEEEFGQRARSRIEEVVGGMPAWLFCDGGHKARELREIGAVMPRGSIVSAHDLGVEFFHERDAADLCPAVFQPVHEAWWNELNVQLAIYQKQ